MVEVGPLHRIPPPRQVVSGHLTDDDLRWLNTQLERVELPPVLVRGPQDLPVPGRSTVETVMAHMAASLTKTPTPSGWCAPSEVDAARDAVCTCPSDYPAGLHLRTCKATTVRLIDTAGAA